MPAFRSLHPATRILLWVSLAIFSFSAGTRLLLILSLALAALLMIQGAGLFLKLLKRIRWILISLLLIYAFATGSDFSSPTLEGLIYGGIQAWRIVLTVALLAVLLSSTTREELLSGIYTLLLPAKQWIDIERIAVRLLLTLHYAQLQGQGEWQARIADAFSEKEQDPVNLRLAVYRFGFRDGAVFAALLVALML